MKTIKNLGIIIGSLIVFALFISIWVPILEAFRAVFGSFYVLIAPGLVMTYALFRKKEFSFIERVPIGFGISIVIMPVLVMGLSQIGMPVNAWTIILVVTCVIGLAGIGALIQSKKSSQD